MHDSVSKHLPEYPHKEVTIHHLLCHQSGMQRDLLDHLAAQDDLAKCTHLDNQGRRVFDAKSIDQLISYFIHEPLIFPPGEGYAYSNAGYILLTKLIEKISGKSYETCLQENIFTPLKMNNSFCFYKSNEAPCAQGYLAASCIPLKEFKNLADREGFDSFDDGCATGCGSIASTVKDMYLWGRALYETKIISKKSKQIMFTPNNADYGYGWEIDTLFDHKIISHDGSMNRFYSYISRFVNDNVCIIILANRHAPTAFDLNKKLAAIIFDQPCQISG